MALPTRVARTYGVDPLEAYQREFDGVLGRLFGNRGADGGAAFAPYGVDVREDEDHLYVEAELPGFRKEDVDITMENQTLTITAERKEDHSSKKGELLLHERRFNRFQRSFTLPTTVNDLKCDAKLTDGVLTVTLDKREETKPRKIQVG